MNAILPHSVSLLTNSWPCRVSGCGSSPRATSSRSGHNFPSQQIHISQCLMPFSPMSPWLTKWHSTMLTPLSIMTPFYGCILPVWPLCQACNCLSQFRKISFSSARLMPLHGFKHLLHRSYNQPNLYLAPGEIAVHGIKQCSFSSWHRILKLRGTSALP